MRTLIGLGISAIVGTVAWFTVGQDVLDKINDSNARSGGGGPLNERIVSARRFTPIVARIRKGVGSEARLVSVTLRPDSAEFEVLRNGRASGYRYRDGEERLERYEVGATGRAGQPTNGSWSVSLLDPRGPERITRAISRAESGDFQLSIGDLQRADTGKVVWIMRGRIGERGVAYYARPDGSGVRPYDPSKPELSKGAALGECIRLAHNDVAKVRRCVARYAR